MSASDSTNYYVSSAWRRLRDSYLREHPVCEECIKHNHVEPAIDIHHKRPFQSEQTDIARWNTFLNPNNLIAVCKKCHYAFHYKLRHLHLQETDCLTEEEWQQAQIMYGNNLTNYE